MGDTGQGSDPALDETLAPGAASGADTDPTGDTVSSGGATGAPTGTAKSPEMPTIDPDLYVRSVEVARGGMGRIVAARDRRMARAVALKELISPDPDLIARFEREALVTGRLQHPAIVPVYEAGR